MLAVTVGRVGRDEAAHVAHILTEAASWLEDNTMWNDWPVPCPLSLVEERMDSFEVYLARDGGTAIGTFSLRWDDPRYWGVQPPDAGYVHQLAILPARSGSGFGRVLLDWAGAEVRRRGRTFLRLDCAVENTALCAYYARNGFQRAGECTTPTGYHAALFQRPVTP